MFCTDVYIERTRSIFQPLSMAASFRRVSGPAKGRGLNGQHRCAATITMADEKWDTATPIHAPQARKEEKAVTTRNGPATRIFFLSWRCIHAFFFGMTIPVRRTVSMHAWSNNTLAEWVTGSNTPARKYPLSC